MTTTRLRTVSCRQCDQHLPSGVGAANDVLTAHYRSAHPSALGERR